METDRRSFLRAAGGSLVLGAEGAWSASSSAQTPAPPVSFPGIPNPLEGGADTIATGCIWTEGPVWVGGEEGHLLFSDVPGNAIYSWDGKRTTVFLAPSGYQGFPIPASLREAGSNGLALGRGGLLIADSGTRALARVDLATRQKAVFAESYQGKRFNSPNDLIVRSNGDIYFTDPAYGLEKQWEDPAREMNYAGVFRRAADGTVTLLTKEMTRPNGLAFSPDERRLYVAQSDSAAAIWRVFDVTKDGNIENSRVLFDATALGKRLAQSLTGGYANIFDRVMHIDMQVALSLDLQVDQ